MKIATTGATGQLGRIAVAKLKERTTIESLVALVRTPEKATDLGIEVRSFDYSKPDSLAGALKDIDTLFLISGSEVGQREAQHKNVIRAAQEAGVKWIVYTSLLHADTSSLSLAPEHAATEEALKASGISYTILRNGWYTENYTSSIPAAIQTGELTGAAGEGKIASATREDFAEAAAIILTTAGHENKTYELSGDEAYNLSELAAEISKQTGKKILYNNLQEKEYAARLTNAGLPEWLADAFAGWDTSASKGDLFDESKTLSGILGRATTPLSEVVKRTLV
ncbi:MAG TPA: SDR family oxidoreductase [Flavipsychrobacter sp.]|nr:SDR family oxidoreductase [Flavipsychrobacter sp.]